MVTILYQPADESGISTTINAVIDINTQLFIDGIEVFPKKDSSGTLTQTIASFGRTGIEPVPISLPLTQAGGTSPEEKWIAIMERWAANSNEDVKLEVDYGGGSGKVEKITGKMSNLQKTVGGGEGPVRWIATFEIYPSEYKWEAQ